MDAPVTIAESGSKGHSFDGAGFLSKGVEIRLTHSIDWDWRWRKWQGGRKSRVDDVHEKKKEPQAAPFSSSAGVFTGDQAGCLPSISATKRSNR